MPLLHAKQIIDGTITLGKLASSVANLFLRADGSQPLSGNLNAAGFKITGLPAPTAADEPARYGDITAISYKNVCRVCTTGNIALSGIGQQIDGVTIAQSDRVLVAFQTTGAQNGIYAATSGSWSRTADADQDTELVSFHVTVAEGTLYADHEFANTTNLPITVGTTALTIVDLGAAMPAAYNRAPQVANPAVCSTNYAPTGISLSKTPASGSYARVCVNGQELTVTSDRLGESFFSADNGTTAKAVTSLTQGDQLIFNALITGYSLATTDVVTISYAT